MARDTEKLTINLTPVDLGRIDVLVDQGLYSTRSDLIRTAVRRLLEEHSEIVERTVVSERFNIGARHFTRRELEEARANGERLRVRVVGLVSFAKDVTPDLVDDVIEHLVVRGALKAPKEVATRLLTKIDEEGRR